jgi:hypothetical protein
MMFKELFIILDFEKKCHLLFSSGEIAALCISIKTVEVAFL